MNGWLRSWRAVCTATLLAGCTPYAPLPPFEPPPGITPAKLALAKPDHEVCGSARVWGSQLFALEQWSCFERDPSTSGPSVFFEDLPRAEFWRACQAHDICYAIPGIEKSACDEAFYQDLVTECDTAFSPPLPLPDWPFWKRVIDRTHDGDWVVGGCRRQCRGLAASYGDDVRSYDAARDAFVAAQQDGTGVLAALGEALDPGKFSAIEPRLAHLVGEACYTFSTNEICDVAKATDWILSRIATVEERCRSLGQRLESCAVYHCADHAALQSGRPADAASPGCNATCKDGVLVNRCG